MDMKTATIQQTKKPDSLKYLDFIKKNFKLISSTERMPDKEIFFKKVQSMMFNYTIQLDLKIEDDNYEINFYGEFAVVSNKINKIEHLYQLNTQEFIVNGNKTILKNSFYVVNGKVVKSNINGKISDLRNFFKDAYITSTISIKIADMAKRKQLANFLFNNKTQ